MAGQGFLDKKTTAAFFLLIAALTLIGALLAFLGVELALIGQAIPGLFILFTVLVMINNHQRGTKISTQQAFMWLIAGIIVGWMYTTIQEIYAKIGFPALFSNAIGPFFIGFAVSAILYGGVVIAKEMLLKR